MTTDEEAEALIDRLVEAAVYREQAQSPYIRGADRELREAREALRVVLVGIGHRSGHEVVPVTKSAPVSEEWERTRALCS